MARSRRCDVLTDGQRREGSPGPISFYGRVTQGICYGDRTGLFPVHLSLRFCLSFFSRFVFVLICFSFVYSFILFLYFFLFHFSLFYFLRFFIFPFYFPPFSSFISSPFFSSSSFLPFSLHLLPFLHHPSTVLYYDFFFCSRFRHHSNTTHHTGLSSLHLILFSLKQITQYCIAGILPFMKTPPGMSRYRACVCVSLSYTKSSNVLGLTTSFSKCHSVSSRPFPPHFT